MTASWFDRLLQRLSFSAAWLFAKVWLRLQVEGRESIPRQGPVLIVANHASFLDPPLTGVSARRWVTFVARASLSGFAPFGWWMRRMGVLQIDRNAPSKDVLRALLAALSDGQCIGLYPEGTRSRDGRVGPFRGGLEFILRRSRAVVIPAGIDGSIRAFPRGAWFPRPRRCTVRFGTPVTADEVLAPGGLERLRETVAELARTGVAVAPPSGDHERVGTGRSSAPADDLHSVGDGLGDSSGPGRHAATATSPSRLGQVDGPPADGDPGPVDPDPESGSS